MRIRYYSRVPFIFPALGLVAALIYGWVSQLTSPSREDDAGLTEQAKIDCYTPSVSSTDFAACASNVLVNGNAPSAKGYSAVDGVAQSANQRLLHEGVPKTEPAKYS